MKQEQSTELTPEQAKVLLPRFLSAVTTMATVRERSLARRLAWAAPDILVFADSEIPAAIEDDYKAFGGIIASASAKVPEWAVRHPDPVRSAPATYLSHQKAARASELLVRMFEHIVYSATYEPG